VPQDFVQAAGYYRQAADKGVTVSMMSLGGLLAEGKGVPQDPAEARQWLQKAADAGLQPAPEKLKALPAAPG
jgi:hypothetical protein